MPLTNLRGVTGDSVSRRVYLTSPGFAASALVLRNTRPRRVPTHIVDLSLGVRASVTPSPAVRSPGVPAPPLPDGSPSATKSPQPGWLPAVVNSGQLFSRSDW